MNPVGEKRFSILHIGPCRPWDPPSYIPVQWVPGWGEWCSLPTPWMQHVEHVWNVMAHAQNNNHKRQTSMPPAGFETPSPSNWAAAGPRSGRAVMVIGSLFIRRFRKIENSDCQLRYICLSFCPYGITRLPLDAFSWIRNIFWRSLQEIQVSLQSDKNGGYFTWRPIQRVWSYLAHSS